MKSTLTIAAALGAALFLAAQAQAQGPAIEKCYGVAKAGKNDCQTATSSCAGTSKKDHEASAWLSVPKGWSSCDWLWSYATFQSGARLITGPGSH